MKKILSMLLVLCMALTLCSAAFAEGKSPVDGMTVAFIPKVSGNSFFEAANDGAQKYAKEWGLTVDYIGAPTADVTTQLELIQQAHDAGTPIISCMGAGNKLDAAAFQVADIYKTSVCPLARVIRKELRKRGIRHLKVVYSQEQALTPLDDMAISCRSHCICPPGTARKCTQRRQVPGSTAFVPAAAGLILAGEVVRDLSAGTAPKP